MNLLLVPKIHFKLTKPLKSDKGEAGLKLRLLPGEFGNVSKKLAVFRDFTLAQRGEVTVTGGVADKKRTADNVRAQPPVGRHSV